jgi:hypothetical protein
MNSDDQLKDTERVMMCDGCGHPVTQSEVDENGGNCINCNENFHPFENYSK